MKEYTLTFIEAGKLVGKHFTTIARYVREGKLDAIEVDGPGRYQPRYRVNREDVLAIWEEKARVNDQKKRAVRRASSPKTTNSSKTISHKGETWQVFNGSDMPIFEGTFDECLSKKQPHETMRMIGGERGQVHPMDAGRQWDEIDRYQFHTEVGR